MSILLSDLEFYGCIHMPEADGVQIGGLIDFTICPYFAQLLANDTIDWVSSSASDTAVKAQLSGRDPSGNIQTPAAITLTGQTKVAGSQSFQRLLYGIITGTVAGTFPLSNPGGSAAVGDVAALSHTPGFPSSHTAQGATSATSTTPALLTMQAGDGAAGVFVGQILLLTGGTGVHQLRRVVATQGFGTDVIAVNRDWSTLPDNTTQYNFYTGMLFPILPNPITKVTSRFATAAPGGSTRYFYEKFFVVNNNIATDGTGANVGIATWTAGFGAGEAEDWALATTLDDGNSWNPRQQASGFVPTGFGSFVTQPAQILVPSPGVLPAGSAPNTLGGQAICARLTVPPSGAAISLSSEFNVLCQTA